MTDTEPARATPTAAATAPLDAPETLVTGRTGDETGIAVVPPSGPPSRRRVLVRRPTFVAAVVILTGWTMIAVLWPHLVPYEPDLQEPFARLQSPNGTYWFGTDALGRDVFSRVLAGARQVLLIAPAATALAVVVGTTIGLLTGYHRGWVDSAFMRTFDGVAALPGLLPIILLVSIVGRSQALLIVTIGAAFAPIVARTVRSSVLVEREKQYVEAAKLRGEPTTYVLVREILPNVTGPILVEATFRLAFAVFLSASLSFIGLGAPPGSPEWGAQVADNRINLQVAWWTVMFPSLAIVTLVVSVTLIADHLREVLAS